MVRVDENLEIGSELEAVLMQISGSYRVVTSQPLGKSCIDGQFFSWF